MANPLDRPPPPPMPRHRGEIAEVHEESTAHLLGSALSDVGDIVRAELNLAMVEVRDDAKKLARTVPMGAAGGVLALLGGVFLLHTIALALDVALPGWAAYLIVAVLTLAVATVLVLVARQRLKNWKSFVPERTLETLQENKQWIQRKLS
jgi:uncharacterized membrane protein YqjE